MFLEDFNPTLGCNARVLIFIHFLSTMAISLWSHLLVQCTLVQINLCLVWHGPLFQNKNRFVPSLSDQPATLVLRPLGVLWGQYVWSPSLSVEPFYDYQNIYTPSHNLECTLHFPFYLVIILWDCLNVSSERLQLGFKCNSKVRIWILLCRPN